jgi:hypothetical protein
MFFRYSFFSSLTILGGIPSNRDIEPKGRFSLTKRLDTIVKKHNRLFPTDFIVFFAQV